MSADGAVPRPRRPAAAGKVKLADVAAAARVSSATVSRVLKQPDLVREPVRERVRQAVDALGYVPHGAARALASNRSHTLGAVIPTLANTFFSRSVEAFQRRLEERGYGLLLTTSGYDAGREFARVRAMVERGIDGLMMIGHGHDAGLYALLAQRRIPFVNTFASIDHPDYPGIGYDLPAASALVTRYLLDEGHRELAMVLGDPRRNDRMQGRLAGTIAALAERGIDLAPERIVFSAYSIEAGREAARALLAQVPPPTAIMASNDVLACGILFECLAQGRAVPGDVSVAGFGDLELSRHVMPALTTVASPGVEIGEHAAEYLLARIEGRAAVLPPAFSLRLIVRGTTGPPGGGPAP